MWRKFSETSFYKKPNCVQMALHLLLRANHKPETFVWNGKATTLAPGQVLTGRIKLSLETGQSQQEVRTALQTLAHPSIGFLTIESTNKFSLISIAKYSDYQETPTSTSTNQQPASNQPTTSQQPHTNTNKNEKNEKNTTYTELEGTGDFLQFWASYPKKVGKDAALRTWRTKKPPLDKCLATLRWQIISDQWKKEGGQYIPMPATWINQGRWNDEPIRPVHVNTGYKGGC